MQITWTSPGRKNAGPCGLHPLGRYGPEPSADTDPMARTTATMTWETETNYYTSILKKN